MTNLPINPYKVGGSIKYLKDFFGREDIFSKINDNLKQSLILLYGQRRIGKSSVLNQIPKKFSEDNFVFIHCNFEDLGQSSISEILYSIAVKIIEVLEDKLLLENENNELINHLIENIQTDINIFSKSFLPEIYKKLGNKKLALLFDEFDVVSEIETKNNSTSNSISFLNYIMQLLDKDKKICIIPVVGRNISKLPKLLSFLKEAPNIEISLLDKSNTEKLITQPSEGVLQYDKEAIEKIYGLTSGHPYLTQAVCSAIYNLARDRYNNKQVTCPIDITIQDIEDIVETAIEVAESGLDGFWSNLISEQKVILAAAAEAENIAISQNQAVSKEPLKLLEEYGIITESLTEAYEQLVEYGFLEKTQGKFKIELVRRWLAQKHQLKDEISNLDKINETKVNKRISIANDLRQEGSSQASAIYEEALKLNPNNFTTVASLAEEYLKIQNIDKACELYNRAYLFYSINNRQSNILEPLLSLAKAYSHEKKFDQSLELYTRAYKIDPESSKEGLLDTIEDYGHQLILIREWTKAKEQFNLVLGIEPNRKISKNNLQQIEVLKTKTNLIVNQKNDVSVVNQNNDVPVSINNNSTQKQQNRKNWLLASLGIIGITVLGFGIYQQISKNCPVNQQKQFSVFCVTQENNNISRGDRTLFPSINNIPRDKGIQSFKKADYQQAAELFKKAVEANPNDPEVRIYYNNALTRQQGSPFTLAVVVPVGTNINDAQEILRGVAQAQDQFNKNKGFNGRLLEIVIANDSNNDSNKEQAEQAKQVAQELVKDTSILGIIGHNSSDATQVALPEYEKAGLAVISPTSTSILLNNPVFFRAVYSDESGGKKLAEYTYKNLKLSKVVIFANPNSPYSNSIREVFTNEFEKLGGKVVPKPMIDLTATTFDAEKEVAKSVYGEKVQAALLFPDTQSINIAMKITKEITNRNKKLKNSPQNSPIRQLKMLSGDTLYKNETLDRGGKDAEGLIITIPWFRDTLQTKPFAQKSNKIWEGGISWQTATSFDATQAFIKALSNNSSRTTVLERLEKVNLDSSETSGYPLQFTENRERKGESILVEIKNGKFVEIK
jgi:ABC-type branched-subunit amino acid transport system substrate-binding protein